MPRRRHSAAPASTHHHVLDATWNTCLTFVGHPPGPAVTLAVREADRQQYGCRELATQNIQLFVHQSVLPRAGDPGESALPAYEQTMTQDGTRSG